jgi:Kef-type K+ transport system membrane component KefB
MSQDPIVYNIFLIFSGAAVVATLALFARQALPVAYILLGVAFGPSASGLVTDPLVVEQIAHIGIIFLLFLMGLDLDPQELLRACRRTTLITLSSSLVFAVMGAAVAWSLGLRPVESLVVGTATAFSSTIVGIKLLPTTVLHHQRMGQVIISILLLQDLLAIAAMLVIQGGGRMDNPAWEVLKLVLVLPVFIGGAALIARLVLLRLMARFDRIREYVFLMPIGWCLGMAMLGQQLGLSLEIGAFVAGITLAASPVSLYVSDRLKPLRDFFLVMFFVALGAGFDLTALDDVALAAVALAGLVLLVKPLVFRALLTRAGEKPANAGEIGVRLGQLSEFSLLIAILAAGTAVISDRAAYLIQLATLLTFVVSPYLVVLRFPTPVAVSDRLRRD